MYVHFRRKRIEIWTPAKLNLYLEVLGHRADGYHEIDTLMIPVDLFDTLRMSSRDDDDVVLSSTWSGRRWGRDALLPPAEQNLAYRAVQLLRSRANLRCGLNVDLIKRIPLQAGLGGGSSDAAAALVGANRLWELNWSRSRLAEVAAELGSDVPFFLYGTAARCRGRGEQVAPQRLGWRPHFVIVHPRWGLSTADVYAQSDSGKPRRRLSSEEVSLRHPRELVRVAFNRLQDAAERIAPAIQHLKQTFSRLDLLAHQLSGSGSAYFGVCRSARQARNLAARLKNWGLGDVFAATSITVGQHRDLAVSQI